MLITTNELKRYTVKTVDGAIGNIEDVLVEEDFWPVRYLVITVGSWLNKQELLLIPDAITSLNHNSREFLLNLSEEQLRDSPPVERHLPISRQYEEELANHYGWTRYWLATLLSDSPLPDSVASTLVDRETAAIPDPINGTVLRSCNQLREYQLKTLDNKTLPIVDLAMQLDNWRLQFLVAENENEGSRPVSMDFVAACSWEEQTIALSLNELQILNQDPYLPEEILGS